MKARAPPTSPATDSWTAPDLGLMLAEFGTNDPNAALNGYGLVEGADLGLKRAAWGPSGE